MHFETGIRIFCKGKFVAFPSSSSTSVPALEYYFRRVQFSTVYNAARFVFVCASNCIISLSFSLFAQGRSRVGPGAHKKQFQVSKFYSSRVSYRTYLFKLITLFPRSRCVQSAIMCFAISFHSREASLTYGGGSW